jgi:hypothetical protein
MVRSFRTPFFTRIARSAAFIFTFAIICGVSTLPNQIMAQSQSINGTIRGVVTEASGAVIVGAQITVKNLDTGFTRHVTTGNDGVYVVANLTLGTYSVSTQSAGFAPLTQSGVHLLAGQDATVDILLRPGSVATQVEVSADAPIIEPARFDMGRTISGNETENLPLTSRNPYNFILFQPGISGHPNTENGIPGILNTNGLEDRVNYQLDGEVDTETDQFGLRLSAISDSYVDQVETISNSFPPEFGNTAGVIYNVITASGTNHLHGEAQYIWRPKAAQACPILSICDPAVPGGIAKPSIHVDDVLGRIGGPILRDKLFVFGAYEHLKRSTPAPIAPLSQAALIAAGDALADIQTAPQVQRAQWVDVRVDYDINQKNQAFVRYNYFHNNYPFNTNAGGSNALSAGSDFLDHLYDIGAQLLTTFTPHLLNELRGSWPYRNENHFADPRLTGLGPNISIAASGSLGAASFGGPTGSGGPGNHFQEKVPSFSNNTTVIFGPHTIKFGAGLQKNNDTQFASTYTSFTFSSVTAYLNTKNGITPTGYSADNAVVGIPGASYHSLFFDFFAQDTWQLRKNLLAVYGVRYDQYRAPVSPGNEPFIYSNHFSTPLTNFAPRLGFAYSPTATTVLRLNAGIFYEATPTNTWFNALSSNGAGSYTASAVGNTPCSPAFPDLPSVFPAGCPAPKIPIQNIYGVTPHFKDEYIWNANLQVAQQLSKNDSLTLSYVMSNGRQLQYLRNLNLINPVSYLADGRGVYSTAINANTRLYPQFGNITYVDVGSNSSYNALTATYTHRLSAGFTTSTSYTWSHSIADTPDADSDQGDGVVEDPANPRRDRGNATINRPNAFTSSVVYGPKIKFENRIANVLANGNTFALLANILSGDPASVTTSTHLNNDSSSTSRPLFVGRNTFVSAPVYQFDSRYTRTFASFRGHYNAQLLVEATNVFNHSNFTTDSTTATTNSAGVITANPSFAHTGGLEARILEFGLKLDF